MEAVAAQCGIEITHEQRISERSGDPVSVFCFPGDDGETFSEWILGLSGDDPSQHATVIQRAVQLTGSQNEEALYDKLYDGERGLLEKLLRGDWTRLGSSFKQLPPTARWTIKRFAESQGDLGQVIPVLCDDEHDHLMLPTSVACVGRTGVLVIPDPFQARAAVAGHSTYMARNTWFEDCGDGGAYVLGIDETVLIFYVDGPGDMVYGRWQCGREQWESMWLSVFGSLSVSIESNGS